MELYAKVLRQFRTVFLRQEHMNTFKTYDSQVVSYLLFVMYLIVFELTVLLGLCSSLFWTIL